MSKDSLKTQLSVEHKLSIARPWPLDTASKGVKKRKRKNKKYIPIIPAL
jgi:hypothetical protein